jgi:hypothetical protein
MRFIRRVRLGIRIIRRWWREVDSAGIAGAIPGIIPQSKSNAMCPRCARPFFISAPLDSSCAWSNSAEMKNAPAGRIACTLFRDSAGIRTQDPNIKSVMLYQLSYGIWSRPQSCGLVAIMGLFPLFKVAKVAG